MENFTEAQHKIVSDAVGEAELTTSGEIVPVISHNSDGYSDVALTWAAAIGFTAMSLFAAFPAPFLDFWDAYFAGWGHQWTTGHLASMTIALGLIAFPIGTAAGVLIIWYMLSDEAKRAFGVPGSQAPTAEHGSPPAAGEPGAESPEG